MGVLNKRNALLGWVVWQAGKRVAKRKAKTAVPAIDPESKRPNRPAMLLAALAAVGGALLFWRRRSPDDSESLG